MIQLEGMNSRVFDFVCRFGRGSIPTGEDALTYARIIKEVEPDLFQDAMDDAYTEHMLNRQIDAALGLTTEHQAIEAAKTAIRTAFYYILRRHIDDYYDMLSDNIAEALNERV